MAYTHSTYGQKGGETAREWRKKTEEGPTEKERLNKEDAIAKICEKVTERAIASVREMLENESAFGRSLESC